MRTTHAILLTLFVAVASLTPAALVHESTFDSPAGTDPRATTDVTWLWSVSKLYSGDFWGHYGYNGTGQLVMTNPPHNWDDPYIEVDTSSYLPTASDMEVVLDCLPLFTANTVNQGVALAMTDAISTPTSEQSNWASGEIAVVARSYRGYIRMYFTNNPSGAATGLASVDVPTSTLTSLKMILTYNNTSGLWKAYFQANGGVVNEFPATYSFFRSKSVVNVTNQMWYDAALEEAYNVNLDNLKIYNSIETATGAPLPIQERTFSGAPGSSDYFYPISIGDLNGLYKGGSNFYDYNGVGQLVVGHDAANTGWPNASVNFIAPASASVHQFVLDVKPGFTDDGVGQMFNVILGNDVRIFVANGQGAGQGVGIFAWQADIYDLLPADAAVVGISAASIETLRLVVSYFDASAQLRLYWSVNGSPLHEHPNSPRTVARAATSMEFQWQVWSASNPSAFTVALDNFAEYDRLLYGEPPTAASPSWSLYN